MTDKVCRTHQVRQYDSQACLHLTDSSGIFQIRNPSLSFAGADRLQTLGQVGVKWTLSCLRRPVRQGPAEGGQAFTKDGVATCKYGSGATVEMGLFRGSRGPEIIG